MSIIEWPQTEKGNFLFLKLRTTILVILSLLLFAPFLLIVGLFSSFGGRPSASAQILLGLPVIIPFLSYFILKFLKSKFLIYIYIFSQIFILLMIILLSILYVTEYSDRALVILAFSVIVVLSSLLAFFNIRYVIKNKNILISEKK